MTSMYDSSTGDQQTAAREETTRSWQSTGQTDRIGQTIGRRPSGGATW